MQPYKGVHEILRAPLEMHCLATAAHRLRPLQNRCTVHGVRKESSCTSHTLPFDLQGLTYSHIKFTTFRDTLTS